MNLYDVFGVSKPVIGMLHLGGHGRHAVMKQARTEIAQMYESGADAVLVENYFGNLQDMVRVLAYLQEYYTDSVYGVNCLGGHRLAFTMAEQYGARFLQIDSVCGHLPPDRDAEFAAELQSLRRDGLFVMGGVRFKYQPVNSGRTLEEDLQLGTARCDAIVVTGNATGVQTDMQKIRQFREMLGSFPLIVGAGMTLYNCEKQLSCADGAIVGSWFKRDGITENPVDPERVRAFTERVRLLRQTG